MTDKEELFCFAYAGRANCNATLAARIAGYADPNAESARLKRDPEVAARIKELMAERCMEDDEVLSRLAEQARGIGEYVVSARYGPKVDFKRLIEDGKGHLIKAVKPTANGLTIEFYDAQAALVQVGRNLKLFTDKAELTGAGGGPISIQSSADLTGLDTEELARLYREAVDAPAKVQ